MIRTSARGIRMQKYCGQGQGRLECRSESILPETFKKYPLDSNPRELLIATGSKTAADRYLKEFYQEMILNNFYVMCMAWLDNISNHIFNTKCYVYGMV